MKRLVVYAGALMLIGVVSPALAQSGKSLSKCEKALAKETTKLAGGIQKAVSKCLDKAAGEVVADAGSAADAAKACASSLRKLENSEAPDKTLAAKFLAKVAKVCDPAAIDTKAEHLADEVLDANDPAGLQAGLLGSYCGEFDGDGSLDDVGEWLDCAVQAAACSALQQVAIEYPRAPEWLGVIATAIAALDPNDPKNIDAATTASEIVGRLDGDADGEVDLVCGTSLAVVKCGNGVVDPGEDCDQGDLNGSTCVDEGFAGGTLVCGEGCAYDTSGCSAVRYVDNGDGTISDLQTGLMWEKKSDDGSIHDVDSPYPWTSTVWGTPADGPAFTSFLSELNGSVDGICFAGYCDWRLPTKQELAALLVPAAPAPKIDPIFKSPCTPGCSVVDCSCMLPSLYYTITSSSPDSRYVTVINFNDTSRPQYGKTGPYYVRAVRTGS